MCICYLFQNWSSQVQSLEEELVRLKQKLKESEVGRQGLSAELQECRKIKVESGVSGTEKCEYTLSRVIVMQY